MFDIIKFGRALSNLRKNADMTQSEVADKLNLSRQAISKYERGESFPDISVLVMIAELFGVTLDQLIDYGGPTRGESSILTSIAKGNDNIMAENISDIINLAPLLKPSILTKLSQNFGDHGIDISDIVALAEYLNDETVIRLIENASVDEIDSEILEKFIPLLNQQSKDTIFQKILDGELNWHFIGALFPYVPYMTCHSEAAVVAGVLPWETLDVLKDCRRKKNGHTK